MKRLSVDQHGAVHLLLALLVVIVLGAVGYAAYYVSQKDKKTETAQAAETNAVPDTLESDSDFEKASQTLDADENDASTDPAQLDADLNSLL